MSLRMLLDGPDLHGILREVQANYGRNFRVVKAEQVRTGGVAGFFAKQHYEVTVEISDPKLIARITGKPQKEKTAPKAKVSQAELATRSENDQAAASAQAWAKELLQKARELNEASLPVAAPQPEPVQPKGVPLLDETEAEFDSEGTRGRNRRSRLPGRKKTARKPSDRMLRATPEQQTRLRELLAKRQVVQEDEVIEDRDPVPADVVTEPETAPAADEAATAGPIRKAGPARTPKAKSTKTTAATSTAATCAPVESTNVKVAPPKKAARKPAAQTAPKGNAESTSDGGTTTRTKKATTTRTKKAPAPATVNPEIEGSPAEGAAVESSAPAPTVAPVPAPAPQVFAAAAAVPATGRPAPQESPAPAAEDLWRSRIAEEIRHQRDKVERFYARRGRVTEEEARNLRIFELAEAIALGQDVASAAVDAPAPAVHAAAQPMRLPEPLPEPVPEFSPLNDGEILVLVGDAHEAYQQACAIIKEYERPDTYVFAVAPSNVTVPLLRAEEHFRHTEAHQLVDVVTQLDMPAIVVVHAPMSILLNESERVRVLQAVTSLKSANMWAVIDAGGRTEALRRWVRCLEGVSGLVIANEAECANPRELAAIDVPVAFRDGHRTQMGRPVAFAEPRAIAYADPRAMGYIDPRAMAYADPRAMGYADPRAMAYADPRAMGYADPRDLALPEPGSTLRSVPRSVPKSASKGRGRRSRTGSLRP